jgi:hypothetical protein
MRAFFGSDPIRHLTKQMISDKFEYIFDDTNSFVN